MLAELEDYEAICGPVGDADWPRVTRVLELASDAVLGGAHGQLIAADTSTITVRSYDGSLWLPQRPVRAVASVSISGRELDPTEFRWTPGGNRRPALIIGRAAGRDIPFTDVEATVTYDHGWDPVPGPIIAAVVAMTRGVLENEGGAVVTSWTAEELSERLDARTVQSSDMALTGSTQATLDQWCGLESPTSVPIVAE